MAFDEIRLPIEVERGAVGGPGFLTNVTLLNSGREKRNTLWSVDRGRWDIGYGIQTRADAVAVRNFFMARLGRARGFRFRDWGNYKTEDAQAPTEEAADGSRVAFQMAYRYIDSGAFFYQKTIYKPVAADLVVYEAGLPTTAYTVDATTGIITMNSPPAIGDEITWTGTFDLPVRFDTDQLAMQITTKELITVPSISIVELKT